MGTPKLKFGTLEFEGTGTPKAYANSEYGSPPPDQILIQLKTKWDLKLPNLLISVTGGGEEFQLQTEHRKIVRRCLINLARTTDLWIVSDGSFGGITKDIGESVRDANKITSKNVVAIGIPTQEVVQNVERLLLGSTASKIPLREGFLDPNHSHYVLMNGIEFLTTIGSVTSQLKMGDKTDIKVPAVLLVVGDGSDVIDTVKAFGKRGVTLVVKGSGKAADVLAYAYECAVKYKTEQKGIEDWVSDETEQDKIRDKIESAEVKSTVHQVMNTIKEAGHVTIYDISDTSEMGHAIDRVILKALIKVNPIKLALHWDRDDILDYEIVRDMTRDQIQNALTDKKSILSALWANRVDFMKLVMDQEIAILTRETLQSLYSERPASILRTLIWKTRHIHNLEKHDCLNQIGELMKALLAYSYSLHCVYVEENDHQNTGQTIENHCLHLFLWSVLSNRQQLAKLFWKYGNDHIAAALVAYGLLKRMADHISNKETQTELIENANEFSHLALEVLKELKKVDKRQTEKALTIPVKPWGRLSCMKIAMITYNKSFVENTFVQSLLSSKWMGKLSSKNHVLLMALSVLPPMQVLIPCLIHFKEDDELTEDQSNTSSSKTEHLTYRQKIQEFYSAPIVNFMQNGMTYVAFLLLFGYTLLSKFDTDLTAHEFVLLGWVFTLCLTEVDQMRSAGIQIHFMNYWNFLDMFAIVSFFFGFVCLIVPGSFPTAIGRMICSISFVACFLRLLELCALHRNIGPKLVMISKMFIDLVSFLAILSVFVASYAIAAYANLYPVTNFDGQLFYDLLRLPYWNLYGELFLDQIEMTEPDCSFDPLLYGNGTLPRCPSKLGVYMVPVLMGLYMMFASILLLNMLIAMFSNTFAEVEKNSHQYWCFQRYTLINEYADSPAMPPPFIIVCLIKKWSTCCCDVSKSKEEKPPGLIKWEAKVVSKMFYEESLSSEDSGK